MKQRTVVLLLVFALCISLFAGCAQNGKAQDTKEIRVGTSNVYITAPADYEKGEMTIDETNYGMVAYYKSANDLMDFDLYYWAKATGETLESAAAEETTSEIKTTTINGIDFRYYNDIEDSVDGTFPTVTYIMEDGDYFVEFVFYIDGENAEKKIADIINSVTLKEDKNAKTGENLIRLGTSDLYITTEQAFEKGEITREDTDLCMVAYYKSQDTLLDFDVYYWAKGDGETLESTAALEQEEFGAEIFDRDINGIATKYYNVESEDSVDGAFPTLTYIIDDGDYLAEIVFWLDGEAAAEEAEAIISTLSK